MSQLDYKDIVRRKFAILQVIMKLKSDGYYVYFDTPSQEVCFLAPEDTDPEALFDPKEEDAEENPKPLQVNRINFSFRKAPFKVTDLPLDMRIEIAQTCVQIAGQEVQGWASHATQAERQRLAAQQQIMSNPMMMQGGNPAMMGARGRGR